MLNLLFSFCAHRPPLPLSFPDDAVHGLRLPGGVGLRVSSGGVPAVAGRVHGGGAGPHPAAARGDATLRADAARVPSIVLRLQEGAAAAGLCECVCVCVVCFFVVSFLIWCRVF